MYRLCISLLFLSSTLYCVTPQQMAQRAANEKRQHGRRQQNIIRNTRMQRSRIILGNPGHNRRFYNQNRRHLQTFVPNAHVYVPR